MDNNFKKLIKESPKIELGDSLLMEKTCRIIKKSCKKGKKIIAPTNFQSLVP